LSVDKQPGEGTDINPLEAVRRMDPNFPPIKAGFVTYRRVGVNFEGSWSHEQIAGALARETVSVVRTRDFVGEWPVTVFMPTGAIIFSGTLKSEVLGQCLRLSWSDTTAAAPGIKFVGIGWQLDPDCIVATFEPVP
jgi:hypothetical protein